MEDISVVFFLVEENSPAEQKDASLVLAAD